MQGLVLYKWKKNTRPESRIYGLFFINTTRKLGLVLHKWSQDRGTSAIAMETRFRALFYSNGTMIQGLILYK
jgi:hypothetical protein